MSDEENIKVFCSTLNVDFLDKLSVSAKEFFIDKSYNCLFQKYGKIELAKIVLEHYNEIKTVADSLVVNTENYGNIEYVDSDGKKVNKHKLSFRKFKNGCILEGYESLKRLGVVTVPVIPLKDIPIVRDEFIDTLRNFPEYKRNPDNPDEDSSGNTLVYVLGGFAALGNPASFHNELVRNLRKKCQIAAKPLFKKLINSYANKKLQSETKLQILFDRMMYRIVSQKPTPESWHRDVMPAKYIEENDEVFGGWLNLDTTDQYFSCIPGSHLNVKQRELEEGFATISAKNIDAISEYRHKFIVPPGHMIIFPQYILHEVVAQPIKGLNNMMRLFTGWRTTVSTDYLHPDTEKLMRQQAVMPLPSGQLPPMFSKSHNSYFLWREYGPIPKDESYKFNLIEWSNNTFSEKVLKDYDSAPPPKKKFDINDLVVIKLKQSVPYRIIEILPDSMYKIQNKFETHIVHISKLNRPAYKLVNRILKSLEEYGFPLYTPYTKEEMELYKPQKIN